MVFNSGDSARGRIAKQHPQLGRMCIIPRLLTGAYHSAQSLRDAVLTVRGPRLFNILPPGVTNITSQSVGCFKAELDKFLRYILDQPSVPHYVSHRAAQTKSLIDQPLYPNRNHGSSQGEITTDQCSGLPRQL